MSEQLTLNDVVELMGDLAEGLEPDSPEYKTALILGSFMAVGPNDERLSEFCKVPLAAVRERMDRLRSNDIVGADESFKVEWFEKDGGVAFLLDCAVADGRMERDKGMAYKLTFVGQEYVRGLLNRG